MAGSGHLKQEAEASFLHERAELQDILSHQDSIRGAAPPHLPEGESEAHRAGGDV